jgi:glycosyltransferase involved in cell wall biosynthesis
MHVVFLNQYYPPDAAPTGVMLRAVAEECARQGHAVTVICADGGYAEGGRVISGRLSVVSEDGEEEELSVVGGRLSERRLASAQAQPTTDNRPPTTDHSSLHIHRLRATRFGRGSFVGKLLDYASYYFGVAWRLGTMSPPPDRIVALTTPPYLSLLARVVSRLRGADHAHWVMDLYPDVMVAHGMLAEGGWKHRLLAGLARWGFGGGRCAAVLTLGPDMAARCEGVVRTQSPESRVQIEVEIQKSKIQNHQSSISPVSWVPLWGERYKAEDQRLDTGCRSEEEFPNEAGRDGRVGEDDAAGRSEHGLRRDAAATGLRVARGWAEDELIVMYSGNMGLGHRFGEVLEVVRRGEEELSVVGCQLSEKILSGAEARQTTDNRQPTTLQKHRFVFYGGGKRRGEIEAFMAAHPEAPVELHDYAPAEELSAHLMTADVHLVSLEPAWTGTMVPSKLQGIFAVGRPVVFVGSAESSIGRWVEESGGGWVVAAGDVAGLRAALEEVRDPEVRRTRGEAAARFAQKCFDRETNVKRVVEVFVG